MELIVTFLTALNTVSPLGLAALLGIIIFYQVKNKRAVAEVSENHLSGMPDLLASTQRMESLLQEINNNVIYLRARMNGGPYV